VIHKPEKKILYVQPSTKDDSNPESIEKLDKMIEDYLDKNTLPGFKTHVRYISYGGELPASEYYVSVSAPYIIEEIIKAEQEGFAGAIIGCFGNPALKEAREVVKIPVVGPGTAALHLACQLGDKLGILGTGARIQLKNLKLNERFHHQFYYGIYRELQLEGLVDRVVCIRTTNRPANGGVTALADENLGGETEALLEQGRKAIEEDGADVLVLGCALMIGTADMMMKELGVPVVDPTLAAMWSIETLISMNLTQSPLMYPFTEIQADKCNLMYPPTLKGYHGYRRLK
jgi:allantoin racemase